MRTMNSAAFPILLVMGIVLSAIGIWQIIKYYIKSKKPYVTIRGEIIGCDKEVHHHRLHTVTSCHAKLKFEYKEKPYTVRDENAVPEAVYDELYSDNMTCGIRITEDDPYSASLDCKEGRASMYKEGLKIVIIGIAVIIFALI